MKSVEEYNKVVARIKSLMKPEKSVQEREELAKLLDAVDNFDGLKFLKVRDRHTQQLDDDRSRNVWHNTQCKYRKPC